MMTSFKISTHLFANHYNNINDNSPDCLLLLCVKNIVTNDINIRNAALPQEICDLLLEVYRETHINNDLKAETLSKFISQFRSSHTRITRADFSDLPLSDDLLEAFLEEHSKSLQHLNISNCNQLSQQALRYINKIMTRLCDVRKMRRTVRVIEDKGLSESLLVASKHYANGILTTTTQECSVHEKVGLLTDDYALNQAMGVFDDPDFAPFQAKKLRELNGEKFEDFDSEPMSIDYAPNAHNFNYMYDNNMSSLSSSFDVDSIKPKEVFTVNSNDNTVKTLEIITWQNAPLETLNIGRSTYILPDYIEEDGLDDDEYCDHSYLINPHLSLKKLVINEWTSIDSSCPYLKYVITPQMRTSLVHLDLSNCSSIGDGCALVQLQSLKTLILYNCPKLHLAIENIVKLKTLRCLDISTSNDRYGHGYKYPNKQLALIVTSLPHLTSLDISGTNLAGPRCEHIPGLASRHTTPLEFLGLYNTATEAAYRHTIPALNVTGDATESQILAGCEAYIDRIESLRKTLNDLFRCFRYETNFSDINRALDIVLLAMSRHLQEKQIQIAASASLFYIVKSDEAKHNFNIKIKRQIIARLLDAMQTHRFDTTMLRNGSLTLIHFKIPGDVIFEYTRLVEILLHIVTNDEDDFIQRLGIYLLNSLACQVDGDQKTLVGDLGAINKMLSLIDSRLRRNVCDEVMETAWSTMWNVTDETPVNCERFLDNSGMDYFISCMHSFPHSAELLRNMMGLLGNVAECPHLRHRLMKPEYIQRFTELLDSESDGIEVSYNAAGILSHIASDGPNFWHQYLPFDCKRDDMLSRMRIAITRWKINSKRNINYRSFEPILRLLRSDQVISEAQYWAVWALANLTRVYCSKYCSLLEEDNGIETLQNLIKNNKTPAHILHLAKLTLFHYHRYQQNGSLEGLENSEEIELNDIYFE